MGLVWFFRRTLLGQAMTASAENPQASSLLGVNVGLMRQISFGLAGLLGGIAAFLVVPSSTVTFNSGLPLTLSGFAVAAFANMTHPGRALAGGIALGAWRGPRRLLPQPGAGDPAGLRRPAGRGRRLPRAVAAVRGSAASMSGDSPRALARLVRGARQAGPAAPAASPALLAAAVVVLLVLPGLGLPRLTLNLGASIVLFGLAATGLNLMLGYVGMLSLGGALYLGASGYIVALTTQLWGWPMLGALLAAIAGSLLLALILGCVLVGLSGHYFAVASLGLATALDALLVAFPQVTGGTSGLTMDPHPGPRRRHGQQRPGLVRWSPWSRRVIGLLVFGWTVAGKRGRILRLVRADELAANVLGVRTFRIKLLVYVIAAFFPALAGALLFPFSGLVTPDSAGAVQSVQLVALIVVGGVGYRLGGFVGALVILWLQALVDTSGNWSLLIYAVVFLLVAFYAPSGIIGALRDGWGLAGQPRPAAQARGRDACPR